MRRSRSTAIVAAITCLLAGCSDALIPGQIQALEVYRVVFAHSSIESCTHIEPSNAERDHAGILHVQLNLRSTTDADQYIDAFISFKLDGQFVEKLKPQRAVLKGNLTTTLLFNSTQPADDYSIHLDYAK